MDESTSGSIGTPLLLRIPQAAKRLGIGRDAVAELCRSGQLTSIRKGRTILIPRAALEIWIDDRIRRHRTKEPRLVATSP